MQHLDEGLIHAWIDGALPADESSRVEAHVAICAECGAAVAEARGLVAAASRIVSSLDVTPSGVIPAFGAKPRSRWNVTPVRAAIAATLVIGVGLAGVRSLPRQTPSRTSVQPVVDASIPQTPARDSAMPSAAPIPTAPPARVPPNQRVEARAEARLNRESAMAEANVGRLADASSRAAAAPPPAMPSAAAITAPTITATTPTKIARRDVTDSFRLSRVEITSAKIAGTAAGGSSRNAVRPGVTSQRSAMAVQADEPVSPPSFVGCYQLNESTDILPARFALRADSAGGNLFDVRYVDSLGRATERILDAGWVIEGGRVVVKTVRRGTILSMSLADGAVTAESVNGPRAGRVTGCR